MTLSAANRRGLLSPGGYALRWLLSAAVLVPLSLLAVLTWEHTSGEGKSVDLQRQGTEYFRVLLPLEIALLDAQGAAVAGQPVPRESLDRAVAAVASADARLGDDLRSHQRWSELRAKIEALPNGRSPGGDAVFTTYAETTDALLALFDKVRNSSKVILDPETDTYFLHDGVTQELPSAIAAAGELADLTLVIAAKSATQRNAVVPDLLARRVALEGATGDLVDDIRFSVDSTESPTMGGNLLGRLDRLRRVVDSILPATAPLSDASATADPALMAKNRTEVQAAAADLSQAMLQELDLLLEERQSTLRAEFLVGVGSVAAIVVLMVGGIALDMISRRRAAPPRPPAEGGGAHSQPGPLARPGAGPDARWAPLAQPPPVTVPAHPPVGGSEDAEPDPWERYIATR